LLDWSASVLVDADDCAACARLDNVEGNRWSLQSAPLILGVWRRTLDDQVWSKAIDRHRRSALRREPPVELSERLGPDHQDRERVGKADGAARRSVREVDGPGRIARHGDKRTLQSQKLAATPVVHVAGPMHGYGVGPHLGVTGAVRIGR